MTGNISVSLKIVPEFEGLGEKITKGLRRNLKDSGVAAGRELGDAVVKGVKQVVGGGLGGLDSDIQRFGGQMKSKIESLLGSSGEAAGKKLGEVAGRAAGRTLEHSLSRAAPELGAVGARLGQSLASEFGKLGSQAGKKFAEKVVSVSASLVNKGFSSSTGALRDFAAGFKDGEDAANSLDSTIARMGASIRGRLDSVAESARATGNRIYSGIGEPVVRAGQRIGRTFGEAASSVGQALAPITEPVREAMRSVVDSLAPADGALRRFASATTERFTALGSRVRSTMGTAFTKVREAARRAASAVGTAVGNALKTLGSQVQSSLAQIGVGDFGQALASSWGRLDAIDRLRSALKGVTDDGQQTARILDSVLNVAGSTSFDAVAWSDAARELVNMGVAADQLAPTMSAVGDIAASSGKITQDSLGNVISVFKDMQSSGGVAAGSLERLGEAAYPVEEKLKSAFKVDSLEALSQKMKEGEVTTAQVMAAIVEEVEGGMDGVSGSMANARGTWEGAMNRLKGVITGALGEIIAPHKPKIEAAIDWVGEKFEELPQHIDRIVAFVRDSGVAEAFTGAFRGVREGLSSFMRALEGWGPKIKQFFSFVAENKEALGVLSAGLLAGAVAFKAVAAATALKNAVMAMSPIGLVVVALAALAAGLTYAYNNSETFREVVDRAFAFVKDVAESVMSFFTETLPGMWDALKQKAQDFWDGLVDFVQVAWEWIKTIIAHHPFLILFTYWDEIKEFIGQAWEWVGERTGAAWDRITDLVSNAWESIVALIGSAVDWVVDALTSFRERLVEIFTAVRERVVSIVSAVRDRVQEVFSAIRDRVVDIVTTLRERVVAIVTAVRERVVSTVSGIRDRLVSAFQGARDRAVEAFAAMRDRVRDRVNDLLTTVRDLPGKIRDAFSNARTFLLGAGKNVIRGLIDGIKSMISNVSGAMSDVAQKIRDKLPFSPAKDGPLRRFPPERGGRNIVRYLADGLQRDAFHVDRAMVGIADRIHSRVPRSIEVRRHAAATEARERPPIQIVNNYPQAEPTSTTVNRSLQYAAAMGVV